MNIRAAKYVQEMRGLTPPQKSVALILAIHADRVTAEVWASMRTLAEETGFKGRASATRVVQKLEKAGAIEVVGQHSAGRFGTRFRFTFKTDLGEGITIAEDSNRPPERSVNRPLSGSDENGQPTAGESQPTATDAQPTAGEPQPTAQGVHKGFEGVEGEEGRKGGAPRSGDGKRSRKRGAQKNGGLSEIVERCLEVGLKSAVDIEPLFAPNKFQWDGFIAALSEIEDLTEEDVVGMFRRQIRSIQAMGLDNTGYMNALGKLAGGMETTGKTLILKERSDRAKETELRLRAEAQIAREAAARRETEAAEDVGRKEQERFAAEHLDDLGAIA